jgi:hypothetical protein
LNLRRLHLWRSVPYFVFELQLLIGVVGSLVTHHRPCRPGKTSKKEVALLLEPTETPHVAVGPALVL